MKSQDSGAGSEEGEVGPEERLGRWAAAGRLSNVGRAGGGGMSGRTDGDQAREGSPASGGGPGGGGGGPAAAAHLRGGAAAPRTRGSSGRPPRPAAGGSGPSFGPGMRGRGAATGARARAFGPRGGPGAPSCGVWRAAPAASGRRRGPGARRLPGGEGRSARSRSPRRPSAGKSPRLARPGAARESKGRSGKTSPSAVRTGRRAEQRPTEAKAHFPGRSLPQTGWVSGLCSLLGASDARLRPPLPHNPLVQGLAGSPAHRPPSRCAKAASPGPAVRVRAGARPLPTGPTGTRPQMRLRWFGPTVSPRINPDNPMRRRHCAPRALLYDSVPKSRGNPAPGFLFPLAPFGNPFATPSPPIRVLLWLQGPGPGKSTPGSLSSQGSTLRSRAVLDAFWAAGLLGSHLHAFAQALS